MSTFEIEYDFSESPIDDSVPVILDNQLSRGLPTFPSIHIEDQFAEILGVSDKKINQKLGAIDYQPTDQLTDLLDTLYDAFFIVEPRVREFYASHNFSYDGQPLDSQLESRFINALLPGEFHESFAQLAEPQRCIQDIIKYANFNRTIEAIDSQIPEHEFVSQRIDFAFEFPSSNEHASALAIEIDGPQHAGLTQHYFDQQRDKLLAKLGWSSTVRLEVAELSALPDDKIRAIEEFLSHPYPSVVKTNYDQPIWARKSGLEALQIALSPIAIARVQKVILFLIQKGLLDLSRDKWKLAVLERDVPCAALAIQDLMDLFTNLFALEGQEREFPEIELDVFVTEEFKSCALNQAISVRDFSEFSSPSDYDAVLDVAVLQRFGFEYPRECIPTNGTNLIKIRSAYSRKSDPLIRSAKPIAYSLPDDDTPAALVYFLQNLFRKLDFLPGQVDILRRSLALKNVIALLPTGAGKSLTYQLSALLQPGIVLIIDPLKSLMQDQNDNLKASGIDSSVFINSSISTTERVQRSEQLTKGHYKFVFISPERLQIEEFRDHLNQMKETVFVYAVVDEAHCVSEWGHDFRTAYLRLGDNLRTYCKTLAEDVPILALTGTASFDVLADVQRELMITEESSIIAPSTYARKELNFRVINVSPDNKVTKRDFVPSDFMIKENVAAQKTTTLIELLEGVIPGSSWESKETYSSLEAFFSRDRSYKNSGIIFCPHVGWHFGVLEIAAQLKNEIPFLEPMTNVFAGKLGDDVDLDLQEVQEQFKEDDLGLLVATKAFGMGIDKPNIRFTIHFSMPQSIESFYQEAGRAGRDKDSAYCFILYSPVQLEGGNERISVDKDLMLSFHRKAFKGQQKEKTLIWELLNQIQYPRFDLNTALADVKGKFDDAMRFKIWEQGDQCRLYVNGDFPKCYGSIDLITQRVFPERRQDRIILDQQAAQAILVDLLAALRGKCPENLTLKDFLTNPTTETQPGFEKILDTMAVGQTSHVAVSFENDGIKDIEEYLRSKQFGFEKGLVAKSCNYCYSPEDFIENLISNFSRKGDVNVWFSEEDQIYLKAAFNKIRDEQDTYKAIYRLSVIGVVDDYVIDYNARHIIATITKKEDIDYIRALAEYIGRYVSVEEKLKTPEKISRAEGHSVIQKCCGYLVGFVYDKIEKKRKQAIDVMETSIVEGLASDEIFTERINTYFDSKFTPLLRPYTLEYSIDLVWEYMDKTRDDPDAVSHLRGACDRLLTENPENAAFLLLRAYSKLLTPSYEKQDAIEDYREGWNQFINQKGLSREQYLGYVSTFFEKTVRNDQRTAKYLEPEILKDHLTWLSTFNETFIKELSHA